MHLHLECIPCLIRHSFDISSGTQRPEDRERFIREVLSWIAGIDYSVLPPLAAREIYGMLRRITGIADPFAEIKEQSNRMALAMYGPLKETILSSMDPFDAALRIALAGNLIDYGRSRADGLEMNRVIEHFLGTDFASDHREKLRQSISEAGSILYILDNSGEIVFDRLFVEQIGPERVTCAVRSAPVINDVTMKDAEQTGLTSVCTVISSGSEASGTPIDICSEEFREIFHSADVVIAKGQGNFESLHHEDREVFHLFVAKCPVIARVLGVEEGSALACLNQITY